MRDRATPVVLAKIKNLKKKVFIWITKIKFTKFDRKRVYYEKKTAYFYVLKFVEHVFMYVSLSCTA